MKIAITLSRYLPADLSGAEAIAQVNAENLVKAGHKVTVLTSYIAKEPLLGPLPHEEYINGVRVLRFFIFRFDQLRFLSFLRRAYTPQPPQPGLEKQDEDETPPSPLAKAFFSLIFCWFSWLLAPRLFFHIFRSSYDAVHLTPFPHTHIWVAARAATLAGTPLVFTPAYHVATQRKMAWQLRHLEACVSKFAVFTEREKLDLSEIGVPTEKMVVVPPGLVQPDETSISGTRFRNEHSLGNAPVVLFAGTKSFDKGFVHLVDAMAIVQRARPDAVLLAMGPEDGQRFGEKMKAENPRFLNFGYLRNEKWDLYDACDVFAMPSRADSFGLVYAEAWMRGKPVVGARCGSVPWVIHEGTDGLLVPFGNVDALACALLRLIDQPALRKTLGEAGKAHVFRTYTVACVVRRLVDLYASLASPKR